MPRISAPSAPGCTRCHDPAFNTRPNGRTVRAGGTANANSTWRCSMDAPRQAAQLAVREAVTGPRVGIVQEPRGEPVGFRRERRRERLHQLVAGGDGRRPEPEPVRDLRLAHEEQATGFRLGEPGEVGLEAVQQLDAAAGTAGREDRHAGLAQAPRRREHRALRHLERLRELVRVLRPRRCNTSSMSSSRAARIAGV